MHLGARGAHPAADLYQPVVLSLSGGATARRSSVRFFGGLPATYGRRKRFSDSLRPGARPPRRNKLLFPIVVAFWLTVFGAPIYLVVVR